MPNEIHSYNELQQQIHQDLRMQHPDWVEPDGNSPICDSYELRLAELLRLTERSNRGGMGKMRRDDSRSLPPVIAFQL
jgi:hypothetical protein